MNAAALNTPAQLELNDVDALTANDRARLIVFGLKNWTFAEQCTQLQRRQLLPRKGFTLREGRVARRQIAKYIKDATTHFNPMIVDGTFDQAEDDYENRRGQAPIDIIIRHTHCGRVYDNRGNLFPLQPPSLHRTKEPMLWVSNDEYVPREWEK